MDYFQSCQRLIVAFVLVFFCSALCAQTMPSVTPISVVPTGPASGGGVATRVTYEMRLAANDAAAATAANEASYVTRAVTIAGPTMGGILRGATALGARAIPWVAAALTAYEAYKWYAGQDGVLMQPGSVHAGGVCGDTGYWSGAGGTACSLPGMAQVVRAYKASTTGLSVDVTSVTSCPSLTNGCGAYVLLKLTYPDGHSISSSNQVIYSTGSNAGVVDPSWTDNPVPVSDDQLDSLVQQHPEWWPDMLQDPQTGRPLLTPEIADDIDDLKRQVAPEYGVDPTTLPKTAPDPNYQEGVAQPRETALPDYCGWAADACAYHKWIEDHWPDKDPKTYSDNGCDVPPQCSGDDILCAEVLNTWKLKCTFTSDTPPPDTPDLQPGDVTNPEQDLGDTSSLDKSGMGWGTSCPFTDLVVPMPSDMSFTLSFQPICQYGPYMRIFILIMAGVTCAGILGGFSLRGVTGS